VPLYYNMPDRRFPGVAKVAVRVVVLWVIVLRDSG
jgi:hypothetical protein